MGTFQLAVPENVLRVSYLKGVNFQTEYATRYYARLIIFHLSFQDNHCSRPDIQPVADLR